MTQSWQTLHLHHFVPGLAPVTLAADPDGILLEERLQSALRQRGFAFLVYTDPLAFRHLYEAQVRTLRDQGQPVELVVSVPMSLSELNQLPWDILQIARLLSLSIVDLFPALSAPVVSSLDRTHWETLYAAYQQTRIDGPMSDSATKAYILQHVFSILPDSINRPEDLLNVLLRRHYRQQELPSMLEEYCIEQLTRKPQFLDWPIAQLLTDRLAFLTFLQERWPVYLDQLAAAQSGLQLAERADVPYIAGPDLLPFDHEDVRVYVDNYFVEGLLTPVEHPYSDQFSQPWVDYGLIHDPEADRRRRLDRLAARIEENLPPADARHHAWLEFAPLWGQWIALNADAEPPATPHARFESLQTAADQRFLDWLQNHYPSLYNQPPQPPVMVHHIPTALQRALETPAVERVALIVLDGMAYDQWLILRQELLSHLPVHHREEQAAFAWIPTVTSVSRQAIFAGTPPSLFPDTISSTDYDGRAWQRFWANAGLTPHQVFYERSLGRGAVTHLVDQLSDPRLRAVGLVVDPIDRFSHSVEEGKAYLYDWIRRWAKSGYLQQLLPELFARNFHVWITADHGNIRARGCGRPSEGALADKRGERVRIYPNETLRQQVHSRFPNALPWPPYGLPEDYHPLVLTDRTAFVRQDEIILAHGSVALEEVIVPLIYMEPARA